MDIQIKKKPYFRLIKAALVLVASVSAAVMLMGAWFQIEATRVEVEVMSDCQSILYRLRGVEDAKYFLRLRNYDQVIEKTESIPPDFDLELRFKKYLFIGWVSGVIGYKDDVPVAYVVIYVGGMAF